MHNKESNAQNYDRGKMFSLSQLPILYTILPHSLNPLHINDCMVSLEHKRDIISLY